MAADAIMAVFETGIMGSGAERLVRVAEITCIPVSELRAAWQRNQKRGYRPPSMRAALPAAPEVANPIPSPQGIGLAKANERRYQKKNPSPGLRVCARCGETKPVAEFDIKVQRTGQLKSWCRPCYRTYQRDVALRHVHCR